MEVTCELSVLSHVRAFVLNLCIGHIRSRIALAADHLAQYRQSFNVVSLTMWCDGRYWKDCHHEGQAEEHGL